MKPISWQGKLTLFMLPWLAGAALLEARLQRLGTSYSHKKEQLAVESQTTQILLLGDSQMEQGIMAHHISNAFCLAFPSQPLYYDSLLLAYYITRLAGLQQVVVSLGLHRLQEGPSVGNRQHLYHANFSPDNTSGKPDPIAWLRTNFISLQVPPREALTYALHPGPLYQDSLAGYSPKGSCGTQTSEIALARVRELAAYADPAQRLPNLRRLQAMQQACKQKGIGFRLIIPPMSGVYGRLCSKEIAALEGLLSKQKIPFTSFAASVPDSLFADADHLCPAGAKVYTTALKATLLP